MSDKSKLNEELEQMRLFQEMDMEAYMQDIWDEQERQEEVFKKMDEEEFSDYDPYAELDSAVPDWYSDDDDIIIEDDEEPERMNAKGIVRTISSITNAIYEMAFDINKEVESKDLDVTEENQFKTVLNDSVSKLKTLTENELKNLSSGTEHSLVKAKLEERKEQTLEQVFSDLETKKECEEGFPLMTESERDEKLETLKSYFGQVEGTDSSDTTQERFDELVKILSSLYKDENELKTAWKQYIYKGIEQCKKNNGGTHIEELHSYVCEFYKLVRCHGLFTTILHPFDSLAQPHEDVIHNIWVDVINGEGHKSTGCTTENKFCFCEFCTNRVHVEPITFILCDDNDCEFCHRPSDTNPKDYSSTGVHYDVEDNENTTLDEVPDKLKTCRSVKRVHDEKKKKLKKGLKKKLQGKKLKNVKMNSKERKVKNTRHQKSEFLKAHA